MKRVFLSVLHLSDALLHIRLDRAIGRSLTCTHWMISSLSLPMRFHSFVLAVVFLLFTSPILMLIFAVIFSSAVTFFP